MAWQTDQRLVLLDHVAGPQVRREQGQHDVLRHRELEGALVVIEPLLKPKPIIYPMIIPFKVVFRPLQATTLM